MGGTANGAASLAASRDATTVACRAAACWDAAMAACQANALAVTTHGASQAANPGDDHTAGPVTPLHRRNVDII
jgi:hypothetical protein